MHTVRIVDSMDSIHQPRMIKFLKALIMSFFEDFSAKHEQLKKRIHSFRIPLSPTGQRIMKVVYFSIPLISGYYIMKVGFPPLHSL